MASRSPRAPHRFQVFLMARKARLAAALARVPLRRWLLVTLILLTVLTGPNGLLSTLPIAQASAASQAAKGHPNRFNPTQDAQSAGRKQPKGKSDPNWKPSPPQHLSHTPPTSMLPGTLDLTPGQAIHFLSSDGRLEVDVPASATTASDLSQAGGKLTVQITQIAPASGSSAGGSGIISFGTYLLQLIDAHGKRVPHGFRAPLTLKLHYTGQESALDLAHAFVILNAPLPKGITVAPSAVANAPDLGSMSAQRATVDPTAQTLTVSPLVGSPGTSVSWDTNAPVAAFGAPDPFTVDLNAGALTMSLPLDLPPGPGGFTPPVSLSYSSAAVSEQHGIQAGASWVGEGWNVSLGSISWSEQNVTAGCNCSANWEDKWSLNDPFGTSAELIPPNINVSTFYDDTGNSITPSPIFWQTAPATHAKVVSYTGPIMLGGLAVPCFRVFLTNGIMEEFGCTADSLEYYFEPGGTNQGKPYISNWLLDLITDRNGNQIHLTYQWDTEVGIGGQTYPRDAELATIEYDSPTCQNVQAACTGSAWAPLMRVNFVASQTPTRLTNTPSNCNTASNTRCDDPLDLSGSGGLAAPTVQSTLVLNDIQVQVRTSGSGSWNTLHDYQLGYEQGGPSTITDPATGKQESVAGMLDLTTFQEVGDDGTTAQPMRTFSYTTLTEHYEDDAYLPTPSTNCGPSWNQAACLLWSQSYAGNSRYLATADNGMGLQQVFSWAEARNNTHGVNGGGTNTADPLYCDGKESQGYPCSQADDQNWSHAVLTQETDSVLRVAQNGQGGQQTSVSVDSTTSYSYQLTYPLVAQPCSDCVAGMYWGNQNDADFLDFYNNHFMGFTQVTVIHPDGSVDVHHYYATEGWGIYDTSQVSCFSINPCHNDPWWDLTNAAHGHETEVDHYDTDGTTLLEKTLTQYQALCPGSGVGGTPAWTAWGNWKGNLVSELDHNNPVASCDVQTAQTDEYTYEGAGATNTALTYRASSGFSGVQGQNQWRYQYSTDGEATYQDFPSNDYFSSHPWWQLQNYPGCIIAPDWQLPDVPCDSVRTWVAPQAGTVTLSANGPVWIWQGGCSSGVLIRVMLNGTQIWPASGWHLIPIGGSMIFPARVLTVAAGDMLHFVVAHAVNGTNGCDYLGWDPQITYPGSGPLHKTTTYSYDSYGRVTSTTTISDTSNSFGSPSILSTHTAYVWNDAVTATATGATGTYMISFPAYSYTLDGNGTRSSCTYTSYDGLIDEAGAQSNFTGAGKVTTVDRLTTLTPSACGYQASLGFSGSQGQNQWYYEYSTDGETTFQNMNYNATSQQWQGSMSWCLIWANGQHPNAGNPGCDSIRAWVAPSAGTVTLSADGPITVAAACGYTNGVQIRVLKNGGQIWPASGWQYLAHGSTFTFPTITTSVAAGDQIRFVLAHTGQFDDCQSTTWDPQVDFGAAGTSVGPNVTAAAPTYTTVLASQGFSSSEGQNQWYYQFSVSTESSIGNMSYNSSTAQWVGSESGCAIGANWQGPGPVSCDAIRTWVAPSAGQALLTANGPVTVATGCGQTYGGVLLQIRKNNVPIWPSAVVWQYIPNGGSFNFPLVTTTVAAGDQLQFLVRHTVNSNACDQTTWDPRITLMQGGSLIETTSTYDSYGNQLTTTDADANAGDSTHTGCSVSGSATTYTTCSSYESTFDAFPISTTNVLNQTGSTGYTQNASGGFGLWPTSITDPNGQTTALGYDALGRGTSVTLPGETSGQTTATAGYKDFCAATGAQMPCVEQYETQRLNNSETVTAFSFFDGYGRLVETRVPGPNGQDVVDYRYYDPSGRPIFASTQYFVPAFTGDPTTTSAFSLPDSTQPGSSGSYPNLRSSTVTDALSNTVTSNSSVVCDATSTPDAACYLQNVTIDALGHKSSTLTDAFGRAIYTQTYTGNSTANYAVYTTTRNTYDAQGNVTQVLLPDGQSQKTYLYDLVGHQLSMTDLYQGTVLSYYDPNGNLIESIDARGNTGTLYAGYDGLNRLLWRNATNTPTGAYVTYTYDSTANGNKGIGRETGETFTGGPGNTLSGVYSFVYDARGQLTQKTITIGGTNYQIGATYDDAGNMLTQTYPDGEIVSTDYTSEGWLLGLVTQQGSTSTTLLSNVSYAGTGGAAGKFTSATMGNGVYLFTASYDLLLRLTDMKSARASDGATLFEEALSYDAASNITSITTTLPQGNDQQQFCYDDLGRLVWAGSVGTPPCTGTAITPGSLTTAQYTQSFAYDTLDRLTSGPLGAFTYGNSSHLDAVTSIGSTYTATYDAAGNMICRAPTSATTCVGSSPTGAQLSYDNEGRLIAWQNQPNNPTSTESILYDGEGRRVEQQITQGGTTSTTAYVENLEEVTTTGTTTTTKVYYMAGSQPIAMNVNGLTSYLVSDALGNIAVSLDSSGNVQAIQLYSPYGDTLRYSTGTMPTNYGFAGQPRDPTSGLSYSGSVGYDGTSGQYTSADPLEENSLVYGYGGGNPVTIWPFNTPFSWSNAGNVLYHIVDFVFGFSRMQQDWQTLTDSNKPLGERVLAGVDLVLTVWLDIDLLGPLRNLGKKLFGAGGEALGREFLQGFDDPLVHSYANQPELDYLREKYQVGQKSPISILDAWIYDGDQVTEIRAWSVAGNRRYAGRPDPIYGVQVPGASSSGGPFNPGYGLYGEPGRIHYNDAESNLFNWLYQQFGDSNPTGVATITTEFPPCDSCSGIAAQASDHWPNLAITIHWPGAKVGGYGDWIAPATGAPEATGGGASSVWPCCYDQNLSNQFAKGTWLNP
jgi:RHS repeat-associated protein